jgi:hypothetical protein
MNARDAATRLLVSARDPNRDASSWLIDAAIGHVLSRSGEDAIDLARARIDAGMAGVAAGIAVTRPQARELVEECIALLPIEVRKRCLEALEPVLARIDLRWTWALVRDFVIERGRCVFTALVADALGIADEALPPVFAEALPPVHATARALRGDQAARMEIEQAIVAGRWRAIRSEQQLFWLAAGAVVQPTLVLDQLAAHPTDYLASDLVSVLDLVAKNLAAAGKGADFETRIAVDYAGRPEPHWVYASIRHGLYADHASAMARIDASIQSVDDLCDPGEESVDGSDLLLALAELGEYDLIASTADRWCMAPPALAELVFDSGRADFATHVHTSRTLDRLFARPSDDWAPDPFEYVHPWWADAEDLGGDPRQSCLEVAALAGEAPWQGMPGSVADLVQLLVQSPLHGDDDKRLS